MPLITKLRKWFNSIINNFKCGLHGHTDISIIESYDNITITKNYRGNNLDKLVLVAPYDEVIIKGKLKCHRCGQIFLGSVKERDTIRRG